MAFKYLYLIAFSLIFICSCSRKNHPGKTPSPTGANAATNGNDSTVTKKVIKPTAKDIIPNIIVVNDSVAHKSIDGRLYYDLLGHRYWKNYKNGKYYLFNKSMYNNDAFKKPD